MDKTLKQVKRFYIDQIDRYFKSLSKIEKRLDKGINKGNLHQVRLNIKNIKAVHQFFKIVEIENKKVEKLEKQINRINKPLGKIRENQVNSELAKKNLFNYETKTKYLAYLKDQMFEDFSKLRKNLKAVSFISKTQHFNQIPNENTAAPFLNVFFLEKVVNINQLLCDLAEEQQVHQIRKNLKLIKSVLTAVKMERFSDINKFKKELNKVNEQIGNWHDTIVFRDSLLQFCSKYPEFEQAVTINLELIEADNLMFQNQLPELITPLILELQNGLEKKQPV